jgi:hypothetical protein
MLTFTKFNGAREILYYLGGMPLYFFMIRRFNLKLIVFFFIALSLFRKAGEFLGYMKNPTIAEQIRLGDGYASGKMGEELTAVNLTDLLITSAFVGILGLFAGLIISIIICIGRNWHWLNPVLSLIAILLIGWVKPDGTNFIEHLLRMPGELSPGIGYYIINAVVCILLALLIFLLILKMKSPNDQPRSLQLQRV